MLDLSQSDFVRKTERERPTQIPTPANVVRLWDIYLALIMAVQDDPGLATSLDHSIATARAWAIWRDAFLATDFG